MRSALEAIKLSLSSSAAAAAPAKGPGGAAPAPGQGAGPDFADDFASLWNEDEVDGSAGVARAGGAALNWDGLSRAGDSDADQPALLAGLRRLRAARAARSARGAGSEAGGDGAGAADGTIGGVVDGAGVKPEWDATSSIGSARDGGGHADPLARAEARAAREAARELLALNKVRCA